MADEVFRFKEFEVNHGNSSMKVGVDAVLLGAWAGQNSEKILEVGTGCGVISLILAQRFPSAHIKAIDIDEGSVKEAEGNFRQSKWSDRLRVEKEKFPEETIERGEIFDLIVSNPPYFRSGIDNPETRREKARHQGSLSVFSLLENAPVLLHEGGRLSVIIPAEFEEEAIKAGKEKGMQPIRGCRVRNNSRRPVKRVMLEFEFSKKEGLSFKQEELTLFENGEPTNAYLDLCRDFYLKF